MTDPLSQPRPKLYGFLRIAAYIIGGLSVLCALYLLFFIGAENGAYFLMLFPAASLVFAVGIWLFARVVEFTDKKRAEERQAGRNLTITDVAIYVIGIIVVAAVSLRSAPFGSDATGSLSGLLLVLVPVVLFLFLGGQHLLKLNRGETEHTEFTMKNMFNPKLALAIFGVIMLIYFVGVYGNA